MKGLLLGRQRAALEKLPAWRQEWETGLLVPALREGLVPSWAPGRAGHACPQEGHRLYGARDTNTHGLTLWLRRRAGRESRAGKGSEEQLKGAFRRGGLTAGLRKAFALRRPRQTRPRLST